MKTRATVEDLVAQAEKLLMERKMPFFECSHCAQRCPYPRIRCTKCGGREISVKASSGEGKIIASTTVYRVPPIVPKDFAIPYEIVIVELSEGVKVRGNAKVGIHQGTGVKLDDKSPPGTIFFIPIDGN